MRDGSFRRRAGLAAGAVCALTVLLSACGPQPIGEGGLSDGRATLTAITTSPAATTAPVLSTTVALATNVTTSSTALTSGGASAPTTAAASATAASSSAVNSGANASPVAGATTASTAAVTLYFTKGGKLVAEPRTVPAVDPLRSSLEELLAGPKVAGDYSEVPRGTRLLGVSITGSTANVNLSSQVQSLQGAPAIPLFLGQVVNTATQFQGVERVSLQVEGRPVRTLGGEGVAVPEPLDRAAVQRLLAESEG